MKYYPAYLRLANRPCLVIGGGPIAEQKVRGLHNAGACVTVISPALTAGLESLVHRHLIHHHARVYQGGDLQGIFLAYAATDDEQVHLAVRREADASGTLLNVVDHPALCDFIMPAIVDRGNLLIAISTSGASPALARHLREQLEVTFGPEYEEAVELLGRLRPVLVGRHVAAERRRIVELLLGSPLLEYLRERNRPGVDAVLARVVGGGVSLASLGMQLH